jgi:hypothetical protein
MKAVRSFSRWLYCGDDASSGVHVVVYVQPGEVLTVAEDFSAAWLGTLEEFHAVFFLMEVDIT